MVNDLFRYTDSIIFALYLIFIFLAVQIWFIWNDIDKNELKLKIMDGFFFKKNCVFMFSLSLFFIVPEFINEMNIPYIMELFNIVALTTLVLFTYEWHNLLSSSSHRKSLPHELFNIFK
jgi:hypothetical protein